METPSRKVFETGAEEKADLAKNNCAPSQAREGHAHPEVGPPLLSGAVANSAFRNNSAGARQSQAPPSKRATVQNRWKRLQSCRQPGRSSYLKMSS
jgi:hypothetical protein